MQRRTTNNTSFRNLSKIKAEGPYQFDLDFSWLVDVNCNFRWSSLSPNEEKINDSRWNRHILIRTYSIGSIFERPLLGLLHDKKITTRSWILYINLDSAFLSTKSDKSLGLHVLYGKWWVLSNQTWTLLKELRKAVSFTDWLIFSKVYD